MNTILIGIDCACDARKEGLARAEWRDGKAVVTEVLPGCSQQTMVDTLAGWISQSETCLLALDAPLGWPIPMGRELVSHVAGALIATPPNHLFRRETDRDIHRRFGKPPLDVGADRIARTAHAALSLLDALRKRTDRPIPLLWSHGPVSTAAAIEVYPAATLRAHGMPASAYKDKAQHAVRAKIIAGLERSLVLPQDLDAMLSDANCLDAVACILAAVDFAEGRAAPPTDLPTARREGWIWVR